MNHAQRPNDSLNEQELGHSRPNPNATADLLAALWAGKLWLVCGLTCGLALGTAALMKFGPSYDASARILVTRRTPEALNEEDRAGAKLGDRAEHIPIIMSPKIVGAAIKKHNLKKLATLAGEDEPEQAIIDALRVRRTAGQDKSTLNIFDLSYNANSEREAQDILTAIIDAYNDYLQKSRQQHSHQSVESIREAANKLMADLQLKQQQYLAFQRTAPLHWRNAPGADGQPGDLTNVHQERVVAIEKERQENLLQRSAVQANLDALDAAVKRGESHDNLVLLVKQLMQLDGESAQSALLSPLTDTQAISTLQSQLLQLMLEESQLQKKYGKDYPDLITVRRKIAKVKDFFRQQGVQLPEAAQADGTGAPTVPTVDFVAVYRLSLEQQLDGIDRRKVELDRLFDEAGNTAKSFAHFLVEDRRFSNEVKQLEALWEGVVDKLRKAELADEKEGYDLELIAPVRSDRSIKRPIQCLGLGGAFGLGLAFGLIYLRTLRDQRVKSAEELRGQFGLAVLGQIPQFVPPSEEEVSRRGLSVDPSLFYLTQPGSVESEAYRSVRTALFFRCQRNGHKVIQLTSSEPQDGKTTVSANLALAMAHTGKRVLLIDADLRCPKVHKLFRARSEIGLSDVLLGEIDVSNALQDSGMPNLSLLCSGLTPANPAELLGQPQFDELLDELRKQFDFIIVDTPPLMAVSDPSVVAARVDGLVLVVRVNKNKRGVVRHSCELLRTMDAPLIGTIVNDVEQGEAYSYGGAYHNPDAPTAVAPPAQSKSVLLTT